MATAASMAAVAAAVMALSTTALATSAQATSAQATSVPMSSSGALHPRVSPCGASNVTVNWNSQDIYISGTISNYCGSGSYVQLFLTWTGSVYNNKKVGTVGSAKYPGISSASISWGSAANNPSYISVTLCEHYQNAWHCGYKVPT